MDIGLGGFESSTHFSCFGFLNVKQKIIIIKTKNDGGVVEGY
jgi:hypothetical protein